MDKLSLILIAPALSMDAFAASLCLGMGIKRVKIRNALTAATYFGLFQAAMLYAGFLFSGALPAFFLKVDHWAAFGLLAFLGADMMLSSGKEESGPSSEAFRPRKMLVTALATSLDALAAGISLALSGIRRGGILSLYVGGVTFLFCFSGVYLENVCERRPKRFPRYTPEKQKRNVTPPT